MNKKPKKPKAKEANNSVLGGYYTIQGFWIRGKVEQCSRRCCKTRTNHYWWTVTNDNTSEQIARCDAFSFDEAVIACSRAVGAARLVWDYGMDKKRLR